MTDTGKEEDGTEEIVFDDTGEGAGSNFLVGQNCYVFDNMAMAY